MASNSVDQVQVITPGKAASPIRRAVENAVRNVVFRAHLPARFGRRPIYVSPGNALQFLKPGDAKFDPTLIWLVDRFVNPGDTVWDIGANGGVFTTVAATKAKTVVAFEPDPFNTAMISRTAAANPDLDIRLVATALSDAVGTTHLHIPKRGRSVASISGIPMGGQSGGLRNSVAVRQTTVDLCLEDFPAPNFVKCDIEGAETVMLRGAQKLLTTVRPTICIEVRDNTSADVQAEFERHGYSLFTADEAMTPLRDLSQACDVIAIPQ